MSMLPFDDVGALASEHGMRLTGSKYKDMLTDFLKYKPFPASHRQNSGAFRAHELFSAVYRISPGNKEIQYGSDHSSICEEACVIP